VPDARRGKAGAVFRAPPVRQERDLKRIMPSLPVSRRTGQCDRTDDRTHDHGKLGRNWLKGVFSDAIHTVLCGVDHNLHRILRKLRLFYADLLAVLGRIFATAFLSDRANS